MGRSSAVNAADGQECPPYATRAQEKARPSQRPGFANPDPPDLLAGGLLAFQRAHVVDGDPQDLVVVGAVGEDRPATHLLGRVLELLFLLLLSLLLLALLLQRRLVERDRLLVLFLDE